MRGVPLYIQGVLMRGVPLYIQGVLMRGVPLYIFDLNMAFHYRNFLRNSYQNTFAAKVTTLGIYVHVFTYS